MIGFIPDERYNMFEPEEPPDFINHSWWHFIYGKETKSEVVYKGKKIKTSNYWDVCRKCGEQIGIKLGVTTVGPVRLTWPKEKP